MNVKVRVRENKIGRKDVDFEELNKMNVKVRTIEEMMANYVKKRGLVTVRIGKKERIMEVREKIVS